MSSVADIMSKPSIVDVFSDPAHSPYSKLMGISGRPTSDRFLQTFGLQPPEAGWATTLEYGAAQSRFDRRLRTEGREMLRQFEREGRLEEWQQFERQRGQMGAVGFMNSLLQDVVSPAFDLLSIGNFTVAGAALEFLRTGSAYAAFEQAAREFGDVITGPLYDVEGAERARWGDVLREYGEQQGGVFAPDKSRWQAATLGFFMDMILDPLNLVTGIPLLRLAKYGARKVGTATKLGDAFDFMFLPERKLQRVGRHFEGIPEETLRAVGIHDATKRPTGAIRAAQEAPTHHLQSWEEIGPFIFEEYGKAKSRIPHRTHREIQALSQAVEGLTPEQSVLLTLGLEDKKRLITEYTSLAESAPDLFPKDNLPFILEVRDILLKKGRELNHRDVLTGHLHPYIAKSSYLHGLEAQSPKLKQSIKQFQESERVRRGLEKMPRGRQEPRAGGARLVAGAEEPFGPGFKGQERVNRVQEILQDRALMEPGRHTMEYDPVIATSARTYETVRREETKQFFERVLPSITTPGADGRPMGVVVDLSNAPKEAFQGKERFLNWAHSTFDMEKLPGYEFFTVTRKKAIHVADKAKRIQGHPEMIVDEVVGAWLLPQPIVEFMNRSHDVMSSAGDMNTALQVFDHLTNFWKGWAVFSPGFHARNYATGIMFNYMEGMGTTQLAAGNTVFKPGITKPGRLIHRTLQGIQFQMMADGANEVPAKAKEVLDSLTRTFTRHKSFGDIPIKTLKIKAGAHKGELWDPQRFLRESENYNIVQSATRYSAEGFNPISGSHGVWQGVSGEAVEAVRRAPQLEETTRLAMQMAQAPKHTAWGAAKEVLGSDGIAMRTNLALGQIMDNSNRYALFYDLLDKGMAVEEAVRRIHTVHFDYSLLTDVEKTIFRRIMPFYAWARYSTPRMLEAMIENPGRLSKIPKFREFLKDVTGDFGDIPTPDYFDRRQAFQLPMMLRDMPLYAEVDLPMLELNQWNLDNIAASLHPLAVSFFEAVPDAGYSFFLRREKELYPGQPSAQFPFLTGRDAGLVQSLLPPVARLGRGYAAIAEQLRTGAPEATAWAMSEATGVKFRPIDTRRVLRGNMIQRNNLMKEFRKRIWGEERRFEREEAGRQRRETERQQRGTPRFPFMPE